MHLIIFPSIVAAVLLYLFLRTRRQAPEEAPASRFERMIAEGEFDDLVIGTSKSTPVLVDFFATWCEPCKLFTPLLAEMAKEYDGAFLLGKIDVDKSRRLAQRYDIASMPTVMLFQDGECVASAAASYPTRSSTCLRSTASWNRCGMRPEAEPAGERRRIEVVPYRRGWQADYERESMPLASVFGDALVHVYHVGSTSVPGLHAKPTIDILVEVKAGTEIPSFDPAMEKLGYICRGECLDAEVPGTPGRFYYVRKRGVVHLTHVHVCAEGHEEIENMLALPDYLRAHPEVAREYGELKGRLAREFPYDNIGYMRGKEQFVQETLERSVEWHREAARSRG